MSDESTSETTQENGWKIAVITIQSPGPRYLIRLESGGQEAVDNVQFNDFDLGLDGRAEVEYKQLEIIQDGDFSQTAKFYDHPIDTERDE